MEKIKDFIVDYIQREYTILPNIYTAGVIIRLTAGNLTVSVGTGIAKGQITVDRNDRPASVTVNAPAAVTREMMAAAIEAAGFGVEL